MIAQAEQNRPFAWAAITSLALHALILSLSAPALKESFTLPSANPALIVARMAEAVPQPEPAPKRAIAKPARKQAASPAPVLQAEPTMQIGDSTLVSQYRLQLIGAAARHKRYPPGAQDSNWEGDVLVRLNIAASGSAELSVMRGSGHGLLDEQALEAFRRAAAEVPVPPALRGREFGVELRAVYALGG